MTLPSASIVYALCLGASLLCAALLIRAYLMSRTRLLLWTAISFGLFALNNLLLVTDLVALPYVDLWLLRQVAAGLALVVLLVGFIWETDR